MMTRISERMENLEVQRSGIFTVAKFFTGVFVGVLLLLSDITVELEEIRGWPVGTVHVNMCQKHFLLSFYKYIRTGAGFLPSIL